MSIIEENMKKLWHSPSSIPPSSAEVHLANIPWCANDESILDFVLVILYKFVTCKHNNYCFLNYNI